MDITRSKGVTILGWYFIISSAFGILFNSYFLFTKPAQVVLDMWAKTYTISPETLIKWVSLSGVIRSIILLFIGINILKLKEFWRKMTLYYCIVIFLEIISTFFYSRNIIITFVGHIFTIAINSLIIYFIARPKVKEQFK
jgi:hypothetical protein